MLQVKVELPGLGLHILFRLRDCEGLPKCRVVGILLAPAEIVRNAAPEKLCLLQHHADVCTETLERIPSHIFSENPYLSRTRVIKAGNQVHQGGFTAARAADNAYGIARIGSKADVMQGLSALLVIAKRDIPKLDRPFAPVLFAHGLS